MPRPRLIHCHGLDDGGYCRFGCTLKSDDKPAVFVCHFDAKRPGMCKFGDYCWKKHAEPGCFGTGRPSPPPTPVPPTPLEQYHMDLAMFGLDRNCTYLQLDMVTALRRVLVLRWHPDKHQETSQTIAEATERTQRLHAAGDRLALYLQRRQ